MPVSAGHPCGNKGCPAVIPRGKRFCPEHEQAQQKALDRERGSAAARGYGARWRRLRGMYLARHPLCVDPEQRHPGRVVVATDVDHIQPKAQGGSDAFSNLRPLCHSCHSAITSKGSWSTSRVGVPR